MRSNAQTNIDYKLPPLALFTDWGDTSVYSYRNQNQMGKGVIKLADCNLAIKMLIKGCALDDVNYLLNQFVTQNRAKVDKQLPKSMMILNANPDFNKGVSKVLKAATKALMSQLRGDNEQVLNFLLDSLPVGSLTCHNLISFLRFLSKDAPELLKIVASTSFI